MCSNWGGTLGNILNTVTLWMLSTKKRFFLVGRSECCQRNTPRKEKWSFLKVPRQCSVPQEGGEERLNGFSHQETLFPLCPCTERPGRQCIVNTTPLHWGSLETAVCLLLTMCSCINRSTGETSTLLECWHFCVSFANYLRCFRIFSVHFLAPLPKFSDIRC